MVFQCINIRQVPWEVLKTEAEGTWRTLMYENPCLIPIICHANERNLSAITVKGQANLFIVHYVLKSVFKTTVKL